MRQLIRHAYAALNGGFGPRQTAFLRALESGKYKQGRSFLHRNGGYCCLGVACAISKLVEPVQRESSTDFFSYDGHTGALPDVVEEYFGFRNSGGVSDDLVTSLVHMNDDLNYSFTQIATAIRTNPRKFFKEVL